MQFTKNYAPDVEVLKPEKLKIGIRGELETALKTYMN